jgi:hypothetical protein
MLVAFLMLMVRSDSDLEVRLAALNRVYVGGIGMGIQTDSCPRFSSSRCKP